MGLLPCLRRGSGRWWLPRGVDATELIGHLMLTDGVQLDAATRQWARQTLCSDPPLLIYAALHWPGEEATLDGLIDWLAQNLTTQFASGEAFLGASAPTAEYQQNVKHLRDYFRTLPIDRWLPEAALWLELSGPEVPESWQEQWPTLHLDLLDSPAVQPDSDCMLQELARTVQDHRSLQRSFDQRLHQRKLAALKQLAYGLSHEINNPLANISTRAQQLQRGESDASRAATLQRIIDQVYRAHEMIADLMFYANPSQQRRQRCDVTEILQRVSHSFREESQRQAIRMELSGNEEAVTVWGDAEMIEEAIRALVRNAVDAIGCEGTIVLSIHCEQDHCLIHVADSGPGLSTLAREHAFDPYFSGREAGRGLGFGLCRAFRIAQLHEGEITLAGGPAGCVATLSLPLHGHPRSES